MKRLTVLALAVWFVGCGGSDAGTVFDGDGGGSTDDTSTASDETSTGDDSATAEDSGTIGEDGSPPPIDSGDPPPPVDSGSPPPPVDSGGPPVDSGGPPPPIDTGVTLPDTSTTVPCTEPGGKMYMGHCYFPLNPRTWAAARDFCASLKAHLVTITSSGEQAHVETVGYNDRWIGFLRPESTPIASSSFKWITGEATTYTRWDSGEPNGSGYCARLRGSDGRWADYQCTQNLPAVCERE